MSTEIFKKTASEKALLKNVITKYNENKRKKNKNYVNGKSMLGLTTNNFEKLSELLNAAVLLEN